MQEGEGPRALGLIVTLRSLTKPAGRSEASDGFPGLSEHADPPPWEQPGSQRAFASLVHALPALFQGLPSPPRPLPLPSPGPPGPPAGRLPLLFSLGFALLPTVVGPDPLKSSHRAFWALGSQPIQSPPRPADSRPWPLRPCGSQMYLFNLSPSSWSSAPSP